MDMIARRYSTDTPGPVVRDGKVYAVEPGVVYLQVMEGQVIPWRALFLCPCGCKDEINPYLLDNHRPRWTLQCEEPVHLEPSIQRTARCKSHFFIRGGKVVWA